MVKKVSFLTIALWAYTGLASAAPTVTFEGEITDQTCSVTINGTQNAIVMLPTVSQDAFSSPISNGSTAGLTPFTVTLSGCSTRDADQSISTTFLGYNVDANGVLGNQATSNAAVGYGIQLTQDSAGTVPVVLNGVTAVPGLVLAAGQTTASHQFAARYYIMDNSTKAVGRITAVAEYTLSYQ